jgi:hypothetical protein
VVILASGQKMGHRAIVSARSKAVALTPVDLCNSGYFFVFFEVVSRRKYATGDRINLTNKDVIVL